MINKAELKKVRTKIIVALDVDSEKAALKIIEKTSEYVGYYKVGLQLFIKEGPSFIKKLTNMGIKVFLDLKLHDIPNTVVSASKMIASLGVSMFTVHCLNGPECLEHCKRELSEFCKQKAIEEPIILGVTVLTSMGDAQLQAVGILNNTEREVVNLATNAYRAGIRGFVSSPKETTLLKGILNDIFVVTPGVRPKGVSSNDQKRVATPSEAILWGSDAIVVGRPITKAKNPTIAAKKIIEEIAPIA